MTPQVETRLTRVFQAVFDDDSLHLRPEMTADDVEDWDSLTHIDLITAVEREFKIKLTTSEVMTLKNVGDLMSLIEKKTGGRT
jgi:acyl carrier protein